MSVRLWLLKIGDARRILWLINKAVEVSGRANSSFLLTSNDQHMSSRRNILVLIQIVLTLTCVLVSLCLLWNRATTDYSAQSKVTESRSLHSSVSCTFEEESPKNFQGDSELKCSIGYVPKRGEKVCVECPKGKFSLSNWIACEPLLNCDALRHGVNIGEPRHGLVHWTYYSADWNGYEVIYVRFNPLAKTKIDYTSLQSFSPSQYFMYPIGFCETDRTFIFASNATFVGTLAHKEELFAKSPACNTCKIKFNLILSYFHILSRLHANHMVLCSSRTLENLVAQFLVSSDFKLVFATLDNLQSDAYEGVLCYSSEQAGTFVAPEQNWPFGATKIFNAMEQPRSDIKSDIWKVPDMVSFILAGTCSYMLDYVQDIHLLCKSVSPHARPNASHLLEEYRRIGVLVFSEI